MERTLIVTGGSRGIGAATARKAAAKGWRVAVNYRSNREAADAVVRAIEAAGGAAMAVGADVSSESAIVEMFEKVTADLGPPSGLVNNAGSSGGGKRRIAELSAEGVNALFAANVTGAIVCMREAILRMSTLRGGSGGVIVNVSSVSARLGAPNLWMDYAASKGALDTLTIGAAKELAAEGIRVCGVRPGLIDTEIHSAAGMPDRVARFSRHLPTGRAGSAEEVGQAIVWLLSDEASYASGAILDVAGAV